MKRAGENPSEGQVYSQAAGAPTRSRSCMKLIGCVANMLMNTSDPLDDLQSTEADLSDYGDSVSNSVSESSLNFASLFG